MCLQSFTNFGFRLVCLDPTNWGASILRPKNARHYADAESQQHYAFSFGGRGRCCLVFPNRFLVIFASISVRQLELTVSDHAEQPQLRGAAILCRSKLPDLVPLKFTHKIDLLSP